MTVNDLAQRAGVAAHLVRYYSQRGLLSPMRNQRNAYREYSQADLVRLRFICRAKAVGFTLREIGEILMAADGRVAADVRLCDLIRSRSSKNARRLADAQRLHERIVAVVDRWAVMSGGVPDTTDIRRLVEAIAVEE